MVYLDTQDAKCLDDFKFKNIVYCHPKTSSQYLTKILDDTFLHVHHIEHYNNVIQICSPELSNIDFKDIINNGKVFFDIFRDPIEINVSFFFHILSGYKHRLISHFVNINKIFKFYEKDILSIEEQEYILQNISIKNLIYYFKKDFMFKYIKKEGTNTCGLFNWNINIEKDIKYNNQPYINIDVNGKKYVILNFYMNNEWHNHLNKIFDTQKYTKQNHTNEKTNPLITNIYKKFKNDIFFNKKELNEIYDYYKEYYRIGNILNNNKYNVDYIYSVYNKLQIDKVIKVYFSDNLNNNNWRFLRDVFFENFYNKNNIIKVNTITECDIIIIYEKWEIKEYINHKKKIILINADPATNSFTTQNTITYNDIEIKVLNAFNGIYSSNLENGFIFKDVFHEIKFNAKDKISKNIIVMNTFRPYKNKWNQESIYDVPCNLVNLRNNLTIYLYQKGLCKIYGKDWPDIKCIDTFTNNPNWRQDKLDILKSGKFGFMLCFENFELDYWVTEKIWDCIENKILPIYYGPDTIYEIFPNNSFIDFKNFNKSKNENANFEELILFINNMTIEEYNTRLKLCIDTLNKINKEYTSNKYLSVYEKSCSKIMKFITKTIS